MQRIKMNIMYGREKEKKRLSELVQSGEAEFVAVYGRRRVGKTYLIREFFEDKFCFYVSGVLNGKTNEQKAVFKRALEQYGLPQSRATEWMDLFFELETLLEDKVREAKVCVIFIDELPSFDTHKSRFLPAFDHFWNAWASRFKNVKLIVCGSATSWMINKLINAHGGLHNRLTAQMYLEPFTLKEVKDYLIGRGFTWSNQNIVEAYMAFGGVPFYLSLLHHDESFAMAIDRLYFDKKASLSEEFDRLFASLFRSPEPYIEIIKVLAECKKGLSRDEIAKRTHIQSGGRLSNLLEDLVNCDFIRQYKIRTHTGISDKDSFYALCDMFSLFHLHFQKKQSSNPHFWQQHLGEVLINSWQGLAFEQVVMQHIAQVKQALGINGIAIEYYAWRSKTTTPRSQIDLILDRADHILNICEIKYAQDTYLLNKDEMRRLRLRRQNFVIETGTKQGIMLTMITPYGLVHNEQFYDIQSELTLDDLFK